MEFFNENYRSKGKTLLSTSGSLTLTAANGSNFPYVGYFELDVEALGMTIPKLGILVAEDSVDDVTRLRKPRSSWPPENERNWVGETEDPE